MAYEFKRLGEVEALTEVPEGANALVEINGDIKRVPGSGLGGATGIKTVIIKDREYDNLIGGNQEPKIAVGAEITYECINMTFEEAYATMANGEPLAVYGMLAPYLDDTTRVPVNITGNISFAANLFGEECLVVGFNNVVDLFWTANGLSTNAPGGR